MHQLISRRGLLAWACLGAMAVSSAHAGSYVFHQGGFSEGAAITITFDGTDLNHDGLISFWDNEIEQSALSFSGNSLVHAYDSGVMKQTNSLMFALSVNGGPMVDPRETVYAAGFPKKLDVAPDWAFEGYFAAGAPDTGGAIEGSLNGGVSIRDFSSERPTVSMVPEPGKILFMGVGLAAVFTAVQRKKR